MDHAQPKSVLRAAPRRSRDLLGYKTMLPSGVAWLGSDEWSMTLRISDINYVAAGEDHQTAIVEKWARLLNTYGDGTRLQETIINRVLDDADVALIAQKKPRGDGYDALREDFNRNVREKLARSSGNTVTEKLLTVTVRQPDRDKAETRLNSIAADLIGKLKGIDDCVAERLTRTQRLEVLSHLVRPRELFTFTEDGFAEAGRRSTQDYVAPFHVDAHDKAGPMVLTNGAGKTFHTMLWVRDYPVWLSDQLITELTEIKCDIAISLHLEAYDQLEGMTMVERQVAELEMQKIRELKKLRKAKLSEDMLPAPLIDALDEARALRKELSDTNQRVFSTVMVIGIAADSKEDVAKHVETAMRVIRSRSVTAEVLRYMQADGLTTLLPMGLRRIPMRRSLMTSTAAILVPFTTQEIFEPGGHFYGVNVDSQNALIVDRTKGRNGNGFILGTSGSGKSEFGKSEIAGILMDRLDDEVLIIDPEREYEPLVKAFGGQVVRIHPGSTDRLNAMDIELDVDDADFDPIAAKSQFVLTMLRTLLGNLTPTQAAIADRVTLALYRSYSANRGTALQPTFIDLRNALLATENPDAKVVADGLELYTSGSLGGFSGQTTVDVRNRLVSFDISRLGAEMKTFGMMVVLDQIWSRLVRNHAAGRRTWIYVDEFHLLLRMEDVAEFFREMWARIRKYGGVPTAVTQNIEAVLANLQARLMLSNSDFLALLGQTETDGETLAQLLGLSEAQQQKFSHVLPGQGLIKSSGRLVGFDSRLPEDSLLHQLFETSFKDDKGH